MTSESQDKPRRRGRPPGSTKKKTPKPKATRLSGKAPEKRGRGRPPGSTKKRTAANEAKREAEQEAATAAMKAAGVQLVQIIPPGQGEGQGDGPGDNGASGQAYEDDFQGKREHMRGRRPLLHLTEATLNKIWQLGFCRCTQHEAAAAMGVSHKTFQRFLFDNEKALQAWEDSRLALQASLRSTITVGALAGNVQLLLHASKYYLGMNDKAPGSVIEMDSEAKEDEAKVTLDPRQMSAEQRRALRILLTSGAETVETDGDE